MVKHPALETPLAYTSVKLQCSHHLQGVFTAGSLVAVLTLFLHGVQSYIAQPPHKAH